MSAKTSKLVPLEERKKLSAVKRLRTNLRLPALCSVIKRGITDSTYELKLEDGSTIVLGSSLEVHQQSKVRARLFDAKVRMPKYDSKEWDVILDSLCDAAEEVETFTEGQELKNYVEGYIRSHLQGKLVDVKNTDELLELLRNKFTRSKGFLDVTSNLVYLPLGKFADYVACERRGRWSERDVANILSRHGFRNRQKSVRYKDELGESKTFNGGRFWISPEGYLDDSPSEFEG